MSSDDPGSSLPRYPAPPTPDPDVPYGPDGRPQQVDRGRTWGLAWASGGVAYAVLLVLHLSTESTGAAAYRAGQMLPIAVVSTVVVALIARSARSRTWPWWGIAAGVLGLSALWYSAVHVAPRIAADNRAEASGQSDYSLSTPDRAGDWTLVEGEGATRREEQALARLDEAPEDMLAGLEDLVYGEYAIRGTARLVFVGINVAGGMEDDLRESAEEGLRNFMAGAGVTEAESVAAGELGGAMACTDDVQGLPDGVVYCAWADAATLGQLTIARADLDIDAAAGLARDFRNHVTSHG
jgi:hypothetical protein